MILCFKRNRRQIWSLNNFIQFSMQYITTIRSSRSQMFFELGVLEVCIIHRKTPVLESLFNKVAYLKACNFIKETPPQMFSYEYCEVFQKILFKEYYRWLLLYFHLMTYISVKLMTYIFNIKYFVSLSCISSFFFTISFETR